MLITRRVATGLLLVPLGGIRFAGAQPAPHTAQVTFVLVNDIYLMSDTLMPDGKRRGGFARLAAVVKAERARADAAGGSVIFAHAGDTLSPSLMSSLDQGASIVTLTNQVAPDIFTPGNHEYDFGKAVFLERMAAATFPRYGANLRNADGTPLPDFKDRSIVTVGGVRIGLTGATYDDSPRASDPGDLKFLPSVATLINRRGNCGARAPISSSRSRMSPASRATSSIAATRSISSSPATPTISSSTMTATPPWSNRTTTRTTSPPSTSPST